MAKKKTSTVATLAAPQSILEATEYMSRIGDAMRQKEAVEREMNDALEAAKMPFVGRAHDVEKTLQELFTGLYVFGQQHRNELTSEQIKTVHLPTGEFLWKFTPPAVKAEDEEKAVADCLRLGLNRFVRYPEPELNRTAMLAEKDVAQSIAGVTFTQIEEFIVRPANVSLVLKADTGKKTMRAKVEDENKTSQKKNGRANGQKRKKSA